MKDASFQIKPDQNIGDYVPYSYRIVSGFFNIPYYLISNKGYETRPPVYSPYPRSMPRELMINLFRATVESIFLYGSECWALNTSLTKSLDGIHTRMRRSVLNVSWQDHVHNDILYGDRTGGSVGLAPGCHAGGREFNSGRTNTQGLYITEEKVLPL